MTPTNPTLTTTLTNSHRSQMTTTEALKPEFVQNRHLSYLNAVRQSGLINMFGAAPYLVDEFPELDKRQARGVLQYWMQTFGK